MQVTNLNFSDEEKAALSEQNFFLLKNSASKKVVELMGGIESRIKEDLKKYTFNVEDLNVKIGKIFRGENYLLFPYVVLDYPKLFSTKSIFAFRTMFWWGHEFSFTLHLQGDALDIFKGALDKNLEMLSGKEVYLCVNDTPWQYNFEKDNYLPVENILAGKEEFLSKSFVKISRKIDVKLINEMPDYCLETFNLFASVILTDI